ncbi:rCG61881, partial [Rattus norvegicus]
METVGTAKLDSCGFQTNQVIVITHEPSASEALRL